jgi:hypothetical protein
MNMVDKIKHRLAKWIWRNNSWTKAVDDIENAARDLQQSDVEEVVLKWQFKFLKVPNKFTVSVRLSPNWDKIKD